MPIRNMVLSEEGEEEEHGPFAGIIQIKFQPYNLSFPACLVIASRHRLRYEMRDQDGITDRQIAPAHATDSYLTDHDGLNNH